MAQRPDGDFRDRLPGFDDHIRIRDILDLHNRGPAAVGAGRARTGIPFMAGELSNGRSQQVNGFKGAYGGSNPNHGGNRRRVVALGAPVAVYEGQLALDTFEKLFRSVREHQFKEDLGDIVKYAGNLSPNLFQVDGNIGLVFTSSKQTGNFLFEAHFPGLKQALESLRKIDGQPQLSERQQEQLFERAKIYPSWKNWETVKTRLSDSDSKIVFESQDRFEVKRAFFRYGIPIPPTKGHVTRDQKFILAPFGAFDEPNNYYHFHPHDSTTDHDLRRARLLHEQMLLTTDVIDVLMHKDTEKQYNVKTNTREIVMFMIINLFKILNRTPKSTSLNTTLEFNDAFMDHFTERGSNFCKHELIWTFPDSSRFGAFSDGNLCCGLSDQTHNLYSTCLAKSGSSRYMLTSDFLKEMRKFCSDNAPVLGEIHKQEPAFFKQAGDELLRIMKEPVSEEFVLAFTDVLLGRLFNDAFMHGSPRDYYSEVERWNPAAIQFERPGKETSGFFTTDPIIIPQSEVLSRARPDLGLISDAFMRAFTGDSGAAPVGADERRDEGGEGGGGRRGDEVDDSGGRPVGGDEDVEYEDGEQEERGDEVRGDEGDSSEGGFDPEHFAAHRPGGHSPPRPPEIAPDPLHHGPDRRPPEFDPRRAGPAWRPLEPAGRRPGPAGMPPGLDPRRGGPAWRPLGPAWVPPGPSGLPPAPEDPGAVFERFLIQSTKNIEIVVLRPNIEHYMLGIIMGLAGEQLGNTLWGQTELSVYDDSMHGVWGMSYKYHERAIVFNEKNLIRLWDIAYDGYNGGKEDRHVNWNNHEEVIQFANDTTEVTRNYQGASMMVMAFIHDPTSEHWISGFKRNWPSPIVFDDNFKYENNAVQPMRSMVGYDNLHVVNIDEFRVFNKKLYAGYRHYKKLFPNFRELHETRKAAGESAREAETATDSLAFQGTMRIKEAGCVKTEILGSGHHGPDFVGAASIRAGKGYKMVTPQPMLGRLV